MKFMKPIFAMSALLFASLTFAAAPEAGYKVLNQEQPTRNSKKIEVLEFFFYGCSHCYNLQPEMNAMEKNMPKDVELIYVPTIFSDNMEPMARTFYALEAMGELHRVHNELFNAWNVRMLDLSSEEKITDFMAQQGVDRKKFSDAYSAFSTQSKVARSKQLVLNYGVRGTPTMAVNGKYVVTGLGPKETMRVVNSLITKVRKERAGKI